MIKFIPGIHVTVTALPSGITNKPKSILSKIVTAFLHLYDQVTGIFRGPSVCRGGKLEPRGESSRIRTLSSVLTLPWPIVRMDIPKNRQNRRQDLRISPVQPPDTKGALGNRETVMKST
jgi:hypothetical protein